MLLKDVKPSVLGYAKTRKIILHPLFLAAQVFVAFWIQYKALAFKHYKMNFVGAKQLFFEFAVDLLATLLVTAGFLVQYKGTIGQALTLPRSAWSMIVYSGSVGICASQTFFCLGLSESEAAYTSMYMMLTPSVTSLLSLCLGLESRLLVKVTPMQVIGIGIALIGTIVLILIDHYVFAKVLLWPSVFLLLHVACMASNIIVWRKLFNKHGLLPLHMTWLSFLVATPTMFLVLVFELMLYPNFPHVKASFQAIPDMLGLIYAITVAYTINYAIMAWCIRHSAITIVSVSTTQIYVSARPALTSIISIIIDRDQKAIFQGLCVAVTFGGLLIATLSKKSEKRQKEASAVQHGADLLRRRTMTQTMLASEEEMENLAEIR